MKTTQRVGFASMSAAERIKAATEGMSISAYANNRTKPIPTVRAKEVERFSRKALSDFDRKGKLQPA